MTSAPAGGARLRLSSKVFQKFQFLPRLEGRQGRPRGRLWQSRARNQPFQGLPPDFRAGRLPKRRTEPLRTSPPSCRGATQRVAWRSGLGQAAASTAVAIPGADSTFGLSGRSSPAEAADRPLRPHAEERRNASRREAGSGRQQRRRLWQSRARNQPFQGLPPDFPGARRLPKRRTEPLRPHAEERRKAPRREAGSGRQRRRRLWQSRARNQPFQGLPPDFPGARRLPKRRTEPLRPHAEERRNASRREAGSGRQRRRRLWQSRARNQPFQGLPPDFPGPRRLPKRRTEPLRPHAEARRNASRRGGRLKRRRRSKFARKPYLRPAQGEVGSELGPTRMSRILRRAAGALAEAGARAAERLRDRRTRAAFLCCRD